MSQRLRTDLGFAVSNGVLFLGGTIVVLIGAMALYGWQAGHPAFVQLRPGYAPIQFNAAVSLILLGVGVWLMGAQRALWLTPMLAAPVALLGFLTLVQYLFTVDLGIDRLLFEPSIAVGSPYPGRLSPNAAVVLLLAATAVALGGRRRTERRGMLLGILGALVLAISLAAVVGYAAGITFAYALTGTNQYSLLHAIATTCLGFALVAYAWGDAKQGFVAPRWFPVLVAIGGVVATLILWQALVTQQRQQLQESSRIQARTIRHEIEAQLYARVLPLVRMAKRWEHSGRPERSAWEHAVELLFRHQGGYSGVGWVDRHFRVRWAVAPNANELMGRDMGRDPIRLKLLTAARDDVGVAVSPPTELATGGYGFLSVVPILRGRESDGFLLAAFRYDGLFQEILKTSTATGFGVEIFDGTELIYTSEEPATQRPMQPEFTAAVPFFNREWRVHTWPIGAGASANWAARAVLFGGIVLSLLLALATHLAQRGRMQALLAQAINRDLQAQQRVLQQKSAHIQLLQQVTSAANEAVTFEQGVQSAVERICDLMQWQIGLFHLRATRQADALEPTRVAYLEDPARYGPFRDSLQSRASGCASAVLANSAPVWTVHLQREATYGADAAAAGLNACFAFPVLVRTETVGVLEFFACAEQEPAPEFVELMWHVGAQLGRLIERTRAEQAVRTSEAKLRAVTDSAHDAIVSADRQGQILSWNRGAEAIFGYRGEEILGRRLALLMPERYRERHAQGMRRMAEDAAPRLAGRVLELHGLHKDGAEFPVEISLAVWRVEGVPYATAIIRDITSRKQAEAALRSREQQLVAAEQIAHMGSWEWFLASDTVRWSDEMYRLHGYTPGGVTVDAESLSQHVHPDDRARVVAAIERAREVLAPFAFEYRMLRSDGVERVFHAQGEVVGGDGQPQRLLGTVQDITERKQVEDEIRRLNEDLERRVRQRTAELRGANTELQIEIETRKRAEERIRDRARQQASLAYISQRAVVAEDFYALMDDTVQSVSTTLHIELCKIAELQTDGQLKLVAGVGWRDGLVGEAVIPGDEGSHAGFTLAADAPVVVHDARRETRFRHSELVRSHGALSSASVIVPGRGIAFGVLSVHSRSLKEFSEDDISYLQSVANVLAGAIHRTQVEIEREHLLLQEQTARAEAERAQARMAFLAEASTLLSASLNFEETLTNVAHLSVPFLADWCAVDALEPDGSLRRLKVAALTPHRERAAYELYRRYPPSRELAQGPYHALRTGESQLWTNVTPDDLAKHTRDEGHAALLRELDFRSYICVPMQARDRAVGTLTFVMADSGRRYTKKDLALAEDLARRCAIAVDNALLYREAQAELARRQEAETQLAAEKERLSVTLYSIGDGVVTTDVSGRIVLMSKAAEIFTGWPQAEACGHTVTDILALRNEPPTASDQDPVGAVLKSGDVTPLAQTARLTARDGSERFVSATGAPIRDRAGAIVGTVLVLRDVSEQQAMEQELSKARNLESIGLLAGGIAHDFNNILTALLGNIALAKLYAEEDQRIVEVLGEAEKAFWRARDLTQQLLTFAKGGAPIKKEASLTDVVADTVSFALRGSNVSYELDIPQDLWAANFDPGQISQVVNNIVINAKQAMADGGIVRIVARNMRLQKRSTIPLPEGAYLELTISDTGVGIPEKYLARIFDPYFSTKQEGSGLGLATAYSIIKKHEGHIDVKSKLGAGTSFKIYLPALADVRPHTASSTQDIVFGQGRLLLMDDEEQIRRTAATLLNQLGYEVTPAAHGEEALALYREAMTAKPFDAVILDLTVPGAMGGKECLQALRALDPKVRAIVSSGYSTDPVMAAYRKHGFAGVVAKPYQLAELSRVVHDVVNGGARMAL